MKKNKNKKIIKKPQNDNIDGYPSYPANEDIYKKYREEKELDPEDPEELKEIPDDEEFYVPTDIIVDNSGKGLDIPGSELDDDLEEIGSEDEENNLYSLGGDNHDDLEENPDDRI